MAYDQNRCQTAGTQASHAFQRKFPILRDSSDFHLQFPLQAIQDLF
jgi:hypothetical protein